MASLEGNRKVSKIRKDHGKNVFTGKVKSALNPSQLKKLRLEKGLTQIEVCKKLGLKQSTYAAIESKNRQVSKDRLDKIIKVLDAKQSVFKRSLKPNKFIAK